MVRVTYDSKGNDITCMKEFDGLKFPCNECSIKYCEEREHYNVTTMKLSDIKIKNAFAKSIPSEKKLAKCEKYWNTFGKQDRYIVVDHNNVLLDGYIVYLTLKKLGIDEAEVEIVDKKVPRYRNQTTAYVYGIHPNSKEKKEYVWRVPKSKKGLENDLLPGDKVLASTKYGIKPVIVTKIEWLDECPFEFPVRRVVRKIDEEPKKIYAQYQVNANDEKTKHFFMNAYNIMTDRMKSLDKNVFKKWAIDFNNKIRKELRLPDKVFGFCRNNKTYEVSIVIFDKEADGKIYETFSDDKGFYIYG